MTMRETILTLAERLAKHEHFSADWLRYPTWAGATNDALPYLEKAKKYKEWAKDILAKTLPPPAWLAEEDPAFRNPELNNPEKNPNRLPRSACRRMEHKKFTCRIRLETPFPSSGKRPKPKCPPTKEEILDLAMRLSPPGFLPESLFRYPLIAAWILRAASPPRSPPPPRPPPTHPPPQRETRQTPRHARASRPSGQKEALLLETSTL